VSRRSFLPTVAVLAVLGFLGLPVAPAAASSAPQATVTAIEGEVMCPICGTLLELSDSPQAQREKVYVARLVAAGKSKAEIKDALVTQYGPSVLAQPKASGFDLTAYLVPAIAIAAAIVALAFSVLRWRRDGDRSGGAGPERLSGADEERLEADISRYDI
jgi:cytochrome c-type biogenesis protein CcmH/NrfF